jgi:hypothetical protein
VKRRWILACGLAFASAVAGCQAGVPPLTTAERALWGVWYFNNEEFKPNSEQKFSWGTSPVAVNATLSIDPQRRAFDLPVFGFFDLKKVESSGESLYRLSFSRQGEPDAEYLVHHDPVADTIWFSDLKFYEAGTGKEIRSRGRFIPVGPENVYKRVGGPPR